MKPNLPLPFPSLFFVNVFNMLQGLKELNVGWTKDFLRVPSIDQPEELLSPSGFFVKFHHR